MKCGIGERAAHTAMPAEHAATQVAAVMCAAKPRTDLRNNQSLPNCKVCLAHAAPSCPQLRMLFKRHALHYWRLPECERRYGAGARCALWQCTPGCAEPAEPLCRRLTRVPCRPRCRQRRAPAAHLWVRRVHGHPVSGPGLGIACRFLSWLTAEWWAFTRRACTGPAPAGRLATGTASLSWPGPRILHHIATRLAALARPAGLWAAARSRRAPPSTT